MLAVTAPQLARARYSSSAGNGGVVAPSRRRVQRSRVVGPSAPDARAPATRAASPQSKPASARTRTHSGEPRPASEAPWRPTCLHRAVASARVAFERPPASASEAAKRQLAAATSASSASPQATATPPTTTTMSDDEMSDDERRGRRERSPSPAARSKSPSKSKSPEKSPPRSPGGEPPARVTQTLEVDKDDAAFILGRGGSTKRKIARVSGTEIELDEHTLQITLNGSAEQCARAKDYIDFVRQQRVGPVTINMDTPRVAPRPPGQLPTSLTSNLGATTSARTSSRATASASSWAATARRSGPWRRSGACSCSSPRPTTRSARAAATATRASASSGPSRARRAAFRRRRARPPRRPGRAPRRRGQGHVRRRAQAPGLLRVVQGRAPGARTRARCSDRRPFPPLRLFPFDVRAADAFPRRPPLVPPAIPSDVTVADAFFRRPPLRPPRPTRPASRRGLLGPRAQRGRPRRARPRRPPVLDGLPPRASTKSPRTTFRRAPRPPLELPTPCRRHGRRRLGLRHLHAHGRQLLLRARRQGLDAPQARGRLGLHHRVRRQARVLREARRRFNVASTRVFRARAFRKPHPRFESAPRDDRSSKNQPKRAENERDRSL